MDLSYKKVITFSTFLAAVIFIATQFERGKACAQDSIVRPIVKEEFSKLHAPYDSTLKNSMYLQSVTIEMLKIAFADKPELFQQAQNNIQNAGKLPVSRN